MLGSKKHSSGWGRCRGIPSGSLCPLLFLGEPGRVVPGAGQRLRQSRLQLADPPATTYTIERERGVRSLSFTTVVPFAFAAGNRTLPAGTYTFEMATGVPAESDRSGVLVISNEDRSVYVAVTANVSEGLDPQAKSAAVFNGSSDHASLSQVWQQGEYMGLQLRIAQANAESAHAPQESTTTTLLATASARDGR